MTLAYAFVLLIASVFLLGFIFVVVSETMLGIYIHQYAVDYGVDPTMLGHMETLRNFLPFAAIISMGLGLLALANILSMYGGQT